MSMMTLTLIHSTGSNVNIFFFFFFYGVLFQVNAVEPSRENKEHDI